MPKNVSVAIFGIGAFGCNHLRVYRDLQNAGEPVRIEAIVDPDPNAAERARRLLPSESPQAAGAVSSPAVYSSIDDCLEAHRTGRLNLDAVSVCVPTSAHCVASSQALSAGLDVLVEKPIASTLQQADLLLHRARETQRILQVGHLERFNPAVAAVEPLLNRPMFFEAHRLSIFTPRSLDVDVVLDLMIHDLDIVLRFSDSPLLEVRAVGLPILSGKVDIANVRLEFASGAVANLTASRVSTERVRKLRFFQPHQYISIDYARRDLLVIDVDAAGANVNAAGADVNAAGADVDAGTNVDPGGPKATPSREKVSDALPHPSAGLSFRKPAVADGEPLLLEIQDFLDCVRTRRDPKVTAQAGRDALALALRVNEEIAAHAERAGLGRF